mgnify:FL=1
MPFRRSTIRRLVCVQALAGALAWGPHNAGAQAPPPANTVLTLEAVLEAGEAKSEALAIAQAGVRRSDADKLRARAGLLPQLNATASYDRTLATEFANIFGNTSTTPACPSFTLSPSAPLDARVAEIERVIDCGAVGSNPFAGRGASSLPDRKSTRLNSSH